MNPDNFVEVPEVDPVPDTSYMIIGVDTDGGQRALVGFATDRAQANRIVGEDYMNLLKENNENPVTCSMSMGGDSSGTLTFHTRLYVWTAVPTLFNTLLNLAL